MPGPLMLILALSLNLAGYAAVATENPAPPPAASAGISQPERSWTELLNDLVGIPYRDDGAQDTAGRWVTFNEPERFFNSPGLNCSGFTVAAARRLLGRDFTLAEASQDRLGDSGPAAAWGEDWDFGLDLILNLSEGYPRRFLPEPYEAQKPAFEPLSPSRSLGLGLSLHSPELENLLARLRTDRLAFFVISRPDGRFPVGLSYYHVGLIGPEGDKIWLYHATGKLGTHRVNLADPSALARLRRQFPALSQGRERRIFLIEFEPGGGSEGVNKEAEVEGVNSFSRPED